MIKCPPFRIEIRPLLVDAGVYSTKEGADWLMAISAEIEPAQQVIALWHETVHLLLFAAGVPAPHDEDQIEAIAVRLAVACPEILRVCRLVSKNDSSP